MAVGYATRALHREHVRRSVWVLMGAPCALACETTLGGLAAQVDASAREAGGQSFASVGDARDSVDAGTFGNVGDAGASAVLDGAVLDGAVLDGAISVDAGAVGAAVELDAADEAGLPAGEVDAAVVHSQAWPLTDAGLDAGAGESTDAPAVVIDGDISEWPRGIWTELQHRVEFTQPARSSELRATCAWQVRGSNLFLAVVVRDDIHDNAFGGFDIWKGDSVQVAFDVGEDRSPYDWEYGVALVNGSVHVHRWLSSDAKLDHFPAAVTRWGDVTVYEVQFAAPRLGLTSFDTALVRGSVAVNESDGNDRVSALELAPGIVESEKSKTAFVQLPW